jgi:hypothetical protein
MWLAAVGDQLECVWTAAWISLRICVRSDYGRVSFLHLQYVLYISPVGCGFGQSVTGILNIFHS